MGWTTWLIIIVYAVVATGITAYFIGRMLMDAWEKKNKDKYKDN